jgi:hypothetical protein
VIERSSLFTADGLGGEKMNSLTTVGGEVIESEELTAMHDRLSRTGTTTATNNSGSGNGRMSSPRSHLVAKAKLSRHDSAPPAIYNDEANKKMTLPPIYTRPSTLQLPSRSPTDKKKVSTPSTSSSSAASTYVVQQKHNNSRVIDKLEKLSQQESFNKSSYFRGVFSRGIDKVKQHTNEINTIKEALELCFDVSEDMRKVIAAKVHADETMSKMMSPIVGSNGIDNMQGPDRVSNTNISSTRSSNSNRSNPWESSPRSNNRKPKPWEEGGTSSNRRPSVQEYMQQIEARIHHTYSDGTPRKDKTENKLSVFRANAALDVAVGSERMDRSPFDEAFVSPRLIRRKGVDQKETMPLMDEALVSPRFVRRNGMEKKELMSPRNRFQEVDEEAAHPAEAELFSGSEHLVKGLELAEDNKRMSLQLEQNRVELNRQKEEIRAFKVAMAEAETAVQMLEESVRELNEDTKAKDGLIGRLESKVKEQDIASAGKQKAHQEEVKELGSALAQLNTLVKEMEAKTKEANANLAEAVEKYNKSEEALKELKLTMAKKEDEHTNEIDDLAKELEACKETMTSSLDNTKKQMDGIIKEKDELIYSLSAKIEILESNLEDMKEMKLQVDISAAKKEKDLNEKIHSLATTLTEKDEKMTGLEKEINELKLSSKKEKRSERQQRRHTKPRPWEHQDIDSLRSSFESSVERSRRQYRKSSHQRRSYDDDVRRGQSHKADRVPTRVRYSTPEPYYEDERDDGYSYVYP